MLNRSPSFCVKIYFGYFKHPSNHINLTNAQGGQYGMWYIQLFNKKIR